MSTPDRDKKPTTTPRCSCGEITHWKWIWWCEPEDLDVDEEPYGEWWVVPCWRCNEISRMEHELFLSKMGLEPDLRLKPAAVDRFIELAMSTDHMLPEVTERRFSGEDPKP